MIEKTSRHSLISVVQDQRDTGGKKLVCVQEVYRFCWLRQRGQ